MRKSKLFLALNLALGLALMPAQGMLAAGTEREQVQDSARQSQQSGSMQLEAIATGLASFHDIDASFSDSLRLASSDLYGPIFLGRNYRPISDADDSDLPYGVKPCHGCGASGEPGTAAPTGANIRGDGVDMQPNLLSPDVASSTDRPVEGGYQGDNFLLGLGYDFAEDGSGQDPSYRVSDDVRLARRAEGFSDADDSDMSPNELLARLREANRLMGSRFVAGGAVSQTADGQLSVDWDKLANEFGQRIMDDKGIQTLVGLNPLEQEPGLKPVDEKHLTRLGERPFELSAGLLPSVSSDGDTVRIFSSRVNGQGAGRQILLANNDQQTDMLLQDQGLGLNRRAYRVSDMLADGVQRLRTAFATQLEDGSLLEVLEDRYIEPKGTGSGVGIFQLQDGSGATVRGELRTLASPGGSLVSFLDLNGGPDMLIHEDAQGHARLALLDSKTASEWVPLDLSGLLRLPRDSNDREPAPEQLYEGQKDLY